MKKNLEILVKVGMKAAKNVSKGIAYATIFTYAGPTLMRKKFGIPAFDIKNGDEINLGIGVLAGIFTGMLSTSLLNGALIQKAAESYGYNIESSGSYGTASWKYGLAVTIGCQVASLAYEILRMMYFHEKNKKTTSTGTGTSSPTTSPNPLEQKVEEPKRDIPNPWDVDIPKIEYLIKGE